MDHIPHRTVRTYPRSAACEQSGQLPTTTTTSSAYLKCLRAQRQRKLARRSLTPRHKIGRLLALFPSHLDSCCIRRYAVNCGWLEAMVQLRLNIRVLRVCEIYAKLDGPVQIAQLPLL